MFCYQKNLVESLLVAIKSQEKNAQGLATNAIKKNTKSNVKFRHYNRGCVNALSLALAIIIIS